MGHNMLSVSQGFSWDSLTYLEEVDRLPGEGRPRSSRAFVLSTMVGLKTRAWPRAREALRADYEAALCQGASGLRWPSGFLTFWRRETFFKVRFFFFLFFHLELENFLSNIDTIHVPRKLRSREHCKLPWLTYLPKRLESDFGFPTPRWWFFPLLPWPRKTWILRGIRSSGKRICSYVPRIWIPIIRKVIIWWFPHLIFATSGSPLNLLRRISLKL